MLKPSAVITSLEDSPRLLDQRLLAAYWRTLYQVRGAPGFAFRSGQFLPDTILCWLETHAVSTWTFLTAWNPKSIQLPLAQNRQRNATLARQIRANGWVFFPGLGIGDDPGWPPEESFWILNIPPDAAVALGRRFGQNALVWWERGRGVEIWWL